jgi:hypothetical protein
MRGECDEQHNPGKADSRSGSRTPCERSCSETSTATSKIVANCRKKGFPGDQIDESSRWSYGSRRSVGSWRRRDITHCTFRIIHLEAWHHFGKSYKWLHSDQAGVMFKIGTRSCPSYSSSSSLSLSLSSSFLSENVHPEVSAKERS